MRDGGIEIAAPCRDASCKIASLVEPVCSSTTICLPMMAEGRAACSWSAISRSNFSTVDMSHFQPEIDRTRCICQRADGNVIDPGGCDPPDVFQRDAAACFELDAVSSQRQSFPNLCGLHVVQKDNVDAVDF